MSHSASRGDIPAEYQGQAETLPHSPRVETLSQKYARHTRNAAVTIAVIVSLFTALSLIGGIAFVVHYNDVQACTQAQDC